MDPMVAARWLGFPKVWEWVEGLAWAVTGSLYATIIPQLVLCYLYIAYVGRTFGIPLPWVICGFFSSPLVVIHFDSTYSDLPSGILVALGFFIFLDLIASGTEDSDAPLPWGRAVFAVGSFALAGNIKYQAVLALWATTAIIVLLCILTSCVARYRVFLFTALLVANIAAGSTNILNTLLYENPFFPLEIHAFGHPILKGPESADANANYPAYGYRDIRLPEPINFALSAAELDWTLRGVAPWYNIDSETGDAPRHGAPSRTGGWGALFVLANGCMLVAQIWRCLRKVEQDRRQRLYIAGSGLLILATACLPRSHELRYWLDIPLIIFPVNLRYLYRSSYRPIVPAVLVVLMTYGIALAVLSPNSRLFSGQPVSMSALQAQIPPNIVQQLHETGRYCDPGNNQLFRFSEAVTGTPGLLSRVADDCR